MAFMRKLLAIYLVYSGLFLSSANRDKMCTATVKQLLIFMHCPPLIVTTIVTTRGEIKFTHFLG
jgi:hypothetical protein